MESKDTVSLLKECDSGSKMAVSSIDEILESVQSASMKQLLAESKAHHEKLGNEIHSLLLEHHSEEKDPNAMAKSMSWLKTNMKMSMDKSDATVADLITDGCNMGSIMVIKDGKIDALGPKEEVFPDLVDKDTGCICRNQRHKA